jgi:hypothetical protein
VTLCRMIPAHRCSGGCGWLQTGVEHVAETRL